MFTLYQKFVEQLKKQQIHKYNLKHQQYLIRCGKIQNTNKPISQNTKNFKHQVTKNQNLENNNMQTLRTNRSSVQKQTELSERPIKGSSNYSLSSMNEEQYFHQQQKQTTKQMNNQKTLNLINKSEEQNKKIIQLNQQPLTTVSQQNTRKVNLKQSMPIENEQPEEFQNIQLVQCPEGCGRKFNPKAIQRHIKICQKGEAKRKVFKVKVVDQEAEQFKKAQVKTETKSAIPKWKKQSQQFRNKLKNIQSVDTRLECPGCGRKFQQNVAQKHIPKCVQRNNIKKKK